MLSEDVVVHGSHHLVLRSVCLVVPKRVRARLSPALLAVELQIDDVKEAFLIGSKPVVTL